MEIEETNTGRDNSEDKASYSRKRNVNHFRKFIDADQLVSYFSPFKLLTVTKLVQVVKYNVSITFPSLKLTI